MIADLEPYPAMKGAMREFVRGDALLHRFSDAFLFEDLPSSDRRADDVYLDEVRRCDIYVDRAVPAGRLAGSALPPGGRPVHSDRRSTATNGAPEVTPEVTTEVVVARALAHAHDAWYKADSVKIGYDISFTRYFYKPQPMRSLEEIRADILALERETDGLLGEIVAGVSR